MRQVRSTQVSLGEIPLADIELDPGSRHPITRTLRGLQELYANSGFMVALTVLLEQMTLPGVSKRLGRPGMDLSRAFMLAVLKQALDCTYEDLMQLANKHLDVRRFLGHAPGWDDHRYCMQTLVDNVGIITPDLVARVNCLVAKIGQWLAGTKPGDPLNCQCDSAVVKANVRWPVDVGVLHDVVRCIMRWAAAEADRAGVAGWRQLGSLTEKLRCAYVKVRAPSRARDEDVERFLALAGERVGKVKGTVAELRAAGGDADTLAKIDDFTGMAETLIDQVRRRVLLGEKIPHGEKIFSAFERYVRWVVKGKVGVIAELGIPVCVVTDQHGFILHHELFWTGSDVEHAVSVVKKAKDLHPGVDTCSFDSGFFSYENLDAMGQFLRLPVMPKRGKRNAADIARETEAEHRALQLAHSTVESRIHEFQCRGGGRIRSRGKKNFTQMTALSALAYNIHRLGAQALLRDLEKDRRQRRRRRRPRAA